MGNRLTTKRQDTINVNNDLWSEARANYSLTTTMKHDNELRLRRDLKLLSRDQQQEQADIIQGADRAASSENASLSLNSGGDGEGHDDGEEEEEEEDWFLTTAAGSSMGNISSAVFPPSSDTPFFLHNSTTPMVAENNHGVLALREAALEKEQQKQQRQNCCMPLWKPKKPSVLWMDMVEEGDPILEVEEEEEGTSVEITEEEDENDVSNHAPSCICPASCVGQKKPKTTKKDSRSGMLLWTTKNTSASSFINCSATAATSTASSSTATLSSSSSWFADELEYTSSERELSAVEPTSESDLSHPRHVWIVTTAALPWMTGTAVNPLLRAGSLWQRYQDQVEAANEQRQQQGDEHDQDIMDSSSFSITLVLPWLCRDKDREALYGEEWKHKTVDDQEEYIRSWLADRAGMPAAARNIAIQWYTAHYHPPLSSIFAVDDVCDACQNVPSKNAVVVLEEPEHLNCYRAPGKATWGQRFCHVIGIVHTNYRAYAQSLASGLVMGPLVGALFASLVRAYCDKVIKLSDVLQSYSPEKQVTCNVHGIRQEFLHVPAPTGNKVYFIGKLLWAKGLDKMLTLQSRYKKATGQYFPLDIYGSGPQQDEIKQAFLGRKQKQQQQLMGWTSSALSQEGDGAEEETDSKQPIAATTPKMPVEFMGRLDHAALSTEYKIFVNPSITEVLCTTTAEALAMGKFVIIPHHPSNHFFSQFPNCLQYQPHRYYEFCVLLKYALTHTPTPLSAEHKHLLTWEAATDRFIKASAVSLRDEARRERIAARQGDERIAQFHEEVCKGTSGAMVRTILHGNDPLKKTRTKTQTNNDGRNIIRSSQEEETTQERLEGGDLSDKEEDVAELDSTTVDRTMRSSSSFSWFSTGFAASSSSSSSSLPVCA